MDISIASPLLFYWLLYADVAMEVYIVRLL